MVRVFGRIDRDSVIRGDFRDGTEPEIFIGIIFVREDGGNLEPVLQQRLDAFASDVVVGENDSFQCCSFSI